MSQTLSFKTGYYKQKLHSTIHYLIQADSVEFSAILANSGVHSVMQVASVRRTGLQWILKIIKRMKLVKTIRWSTHIDIFDEKNFSKFFFGMGSQKVIFFLFNDIELLEKIIRDIQFVKKCSIMGVLTKFCRKPPFWGPYWPLNYFSHTPMNLSRQDASFKHPYVYI